MSLYPPEGNSTWTPRHIPDSRKAPAHGLLRCRCGGDDWRWIGLRHVFCEQCHCSREAPVDFFHVVEVVPPRPRSCNRHDDCDKADNINPGRGVTEHCHSDDCEECFPK